MRLTRSFSHAFNGLAFMFRSQANARIHLAAAIFVAAAGLFFGLGRDEWLWVILAIGLVWAAEAMNTAFEFLCDVVSPAHSDAVRRAKDIAAGAVVITAIVAGVIGVVVFFPYIF